MNELRETYLAQLQKLLDKLEKEDEIDPHPQLLPQQVTRIKDRFMEIEIQLDNLKKREIRRIIQIYREFFVRLQKIKLLLKSKGKKTGAQIEMSSDIIDELMKDVQEQINIMQTPIDEKMRQKELRLNRMNIISGIIGGIIGSIIGSVITYLLTQYFG